MRDSMHTVKRSSSGIHKAASLSGRPLQFLTWILCTESEKYREMAAAAETPPKGGFQFGDDHEYPPLAVQKADWGLSAARYQLMFGAVLIVHLLVRVGEAAILHILDWDAWDKIFSHFVHNEPAARFVAPSVFDTEIHSVSVLFWTYAWMCCQGITLPNLATPPRKWQHHIAIFEPVLRLMPSPRLFIFQYGN